jgi:hypothetical protein
MDERKEEERKGREKGKRERRESAAWVGVCECVTV